MAFNVVERKALAGLALLYATRMLGLFMVLPVLSLYGLSLTDATPKTLGLALGIYGITQAVLQIPFGAASDRFGRKPLILIGLVIFLFGSALAALSDSVNGLIIGRALQGAGAISSVVLALLADYTREQERSKAMAIIGAVIGGSFVLAVILGPIIAGIAGLAGLFWFTSALAFAGLLIVLWLPEVPAPQAHPERSFHLRQVAGVFADSQVLVLSVGIFVLHMTMTGLFVALPIILVAREFQAESLGLVYAPVMVLSFIAMAPMMMFSERKQAHVKFLRLAGALLVLALLLIGQVEHGGLTALALFVFFVGFNFIEATLPSLLSRKVTVATRGTAMGVFSTSQFLGAAFGGVIGGILFEAYSVSGIVMVGIVLQVLWALLLLWVKPVIKTQAKAQQQAPEA